MRRETVCRVINNVDLGGETVCTVGAIPHQVPGSITVRTL